MFYAHIVLAKKGPLARIWLAAHWDKKLTKAHVFETNIEQSVEGIMQPKVKLALRTSGHLLLGVVRIYSRKAKYLLADCNEAFVKIKMAFRPGMVDLPEEHREAAVNAITLPEVFHDFDTAIPELNDVDIEAQFSINQSRADEITMREDYGSLSMSIHDDGFGDMGFDADTSELVREGMETHIDENLFAEELGREIDKTKEPIPGTSRDILDGDLPDAHLAEDGFGEEFGQPAAGLFEGDIFADAPLPQAEIAALPQRAEDADDDLDHFDVGAPSPMASSMGSRPPTPLGRPDSVDLGSPSAPLNNVPGITEPINDTNALTTNAEQNADPPTDQTTLLQNEEESFALAPVDASAYKGVTKAKRKRKLIVDEVKNISGEEMKSQLANTSDIVTTLDLAPPTKRLMYWKETGGVEKLFALPSRDIPARGLFKNYQRHLLSRAFGVEDFSVLGAADLLALEQTHEVESPTNRKGRKRKLPPVVEPPVEVAPEPKTSEASQLAQSLQFDSILSPEPETLRGGELHDRVSGVSLDMGGAVNETLMPPPPTPEYTPCPMNVLGPLTPGIPSLSGMDLHDDFHHSGLTPAGLHHGGVTPHHSDIDNIDTIPHLPADQVSSILEEASGGRLGFDDLHYTHSEGVNGLAPALSADCATSVIGEDNDFPMNVGEALPGDEQMENETDEQFEERVLNKRAAQMFVAVRNRLQQRDGMYLSEMTVRNNRKQAAQKFYSLLVLKKFRALEITQKESYGDILVTRGPMFDNPKL